MSDLQIKQDIQEFIKELTDLRVVPIIDKEIKQSLKPEFTAEYNAVRILILIKYAFNNNVDSKIRFSFYDFLLRFPICMKYILDKNGIREEFSNAELLSIDQKMIKHISCAWDPDYYNYLSFLKARDIISFSFENEFTIKLTDLGLDITSRLETAETEKWVRRSKHLKRLFREKSDSTIAEIIKQDFSFAVV